MRERYLQSLAILLAGLFTAERSRSKSEPSALSLPSAEPEPMNAPAERSKSN